MRQRVLVAIAAGAVLAVTMALARPVQQAPDASFDTSVASPAYTTEHPVVVIDEAHNNFHTMDGRYQPFASLATNDGYGVRAGKTPFTAASLSGVRILVIANALGPGMTVGDDTSPPAFTKAECDAVSAWVRGGGSLLLISDHTPMGAANAILAQTFGVTMGQGYVFAVSANHHGQNPSQLVFSRENTLLADHAITRGRTTPERIARVMSFTGQSLTVPSGAAPLLVLAPDAWEAPTRAVYQEILAENPALATAAAFTTTKASRVAGRVQGLAMPFGQGRVVMLGEAAMMSAQVFPAANGGQGRMGMNVPGSDDKQFGLNVLHWLSGALR